VARRHKVTLLREDAQDKFRLDELVTTTGFIKSDNLPIFAESFLRVITIGATGSTVVIRTSIEGAPFSLLATIVGTGVVVLDVSTWDFVQIETTVYGGTPFELVASGFLC